MKQLKLRKVMLFCTAVVFTISCNRDHLYISNSNVKNSVKALLEVSYKITTTRDYDINSARIPSSDMPALNPSNEKQSVKMELFENGQLNLTIEELNFKEKIRNLHKTLPDNSPQIVKTVINGNTVKFYDDKGSLLGTENIPIPNHSNLVKTIKEIGSNFSSEDINETIATMQGHHLINNLEELLEGLDEEDNNPQKGGSPIKIVEQGTNYVTLRMPLNNIEQGMSEEAVLLIDKAQNKIVGTRIYDNNKLLQSTFFGYSKGETKSLNAIKTIQKIKLASGNEIDMVSYSKIDEMEFNLNL